MLKFAILATSATIAVCALPYESHAQNVAVPYNSPPSSAAKQPTNLGIVPAAPEVKVPPDAQEPAKQQKKEELKKAAKAPAPPPVEARSTLPDLQSNKGLEGLTPQNAVLIQKVRAQIQQKMQEAMANISKEETKILDMPSDTTGEAAAPKTGSSLKITGNVVQWGPMDLQQIGLKLGYNPQQAAQRCRLAFTGAIETDKDPATLGAPTTGIIEVYFTGRIKQVMLSPLAACDPPASLPKDAGLLIRNENKLFVTLPGATTCVPPQPISGNARLTVTYTGDGKGQCQF
jgi:hypothetical protein